MWKFQDMVPQNGLFIMEKHIKVDDLGYPYFRKPPCLNCGFHEQSAVDWDSPNLVMLFNIYINGNFRILKWRYVGAI
jgi:hypothetical protein